MTLGVGRELASRSAVRFATFAVGLVHVLVAAIWLGAMAYSLGVVQPRATRFLTDEREREGFFVTLGAGARRPVLAAIATLAATGAVLVALAPHRSPGWWALIAVKLGVLLLALALFARVSWRLWPRRLFATDEELPALRRSFRRVAVALTVLVAVEVALGVAARTWS